MAEREVDDVDLEEVLVGDGELDGADHVAGLAGAALVEHLEADEVHARRHALELGVLQILLPADQAGDVRAVTVVVKRSALADTAIGEVVKRLDAVTERGRRMDARVDERDGDTRAAEVVRRETQCAEQGTDGGCRVNGVRGRRGIDDLVGRGRRSGLGLFGSGGSRPDDRILRATVEDRGVAVRLELARRKLNGESTDTRELGVDVLASVGQKLPSPRVVTGLRLENDALGLTGPLPVAKRAIELVLGRCRIREAHEGRKRRRARREFERLGGRIRASDTARSEPNTPRTTHKRLIMT